MQFRNVFSRSALVLMPFLLVVSGCSTGAKPSGTVTGKVTYKGEVVPVGEVVFNLTGKELGGAIAQINSDGTYKATGVPLGNVVVTVSTPPKLDPAAAKKGIGENPFAKRKGIVLKANSENIVSVPLKYSRPASSGLSLTVKEGTQSFDIELK